VTGVRGTHRDGDGLAGIHGEDRRTEAETDLIDGLGKYTDGDRGKDQCGEYSHGIVIRFWLWWIEAVGHMTPKRRLRLSGLMLIGKKKSMDRLTYDRQIDVKCVDPRCSSTHTVGSASSTG
jgi:hypothetical protein